MEALILTIAMLVIGKMFGVVGIGGLFVLAAVVAMGVGLYGKES